MRMWMLSQRYQCPLHPEGNPSAPRWNLPVCSAYGGDYISPNSPDATWELVLIVTTPQQLEAAKKDPRVVVCGKLYSKPPAQLLQAYAKWLDPTETYQFLGQVLDKLAETEPMFHLE